MACPAPGDQAFQQKCLGKISEVARAGRTVLFVSHQAAAVENLCTKGIVLESGRVAFEGTQHEALHYYANSTDRPASELLLKLFTAEDSKVVLKHVRKLRDEEAARLKAYAHIEARLAREAPTKTLWRATVRYGIHRSRAVIAWCDETLR